MSGIVQKLQPRPTDIFVAVMGMTGSGKSTFISLCTLEDIEIGHNLKACTQQVAVYKFRWSSTVDIYLVDTPGFDDTHRSDTVILKEIATWLTQSYENNIQLSGILYLHRITDPRMGGSARKNLFIFRKLCGAGVLKNVLLVTTMWENTQPALGQAREEELAGTEDFWGVLVRNGARVERHDNTRESAMSLLKGLVGKDRVTMSIQKEMVSEHKALDQTQAGIELESALQKEREKFKKELEEVQEMMKHALEERDHESAEELRKHKADMQGKIDRLLQEREDLKVTMEKMHAEKFAELERRYKEQEAKARENEERMQRELLEHRKREEETKAELNFIRRQLKSKEAKAVNRTRSAPGPHRAKENISVAIHGSYYFFVGPLYSTHQCTTSLVDYRQQNVGKARYVAFGEDGSWYLHYHVEGTCRTRTSNNFSRICPMLYSWLNEHEASGCPVQVSLGKTSYYARMQDGSWTRSLPEKITDQEQNWNRVQRVWLGHGDDYIIERKDGSYTWNLQKCENLGRHLKNSRPIKDIALNPEDPDAYIVLFYTGKCSYNVGSSKRFSEFKLQKYMSRNFGTT